MMKASTLSHKNTKNGKLMYKQCSQQWTKQKQDDKSKMIGKDAWKLERQL